MKKQITKILLGIKKESLLVSGQVMSQTDFIEKEPINISSIYLGVSFFTPFIVIVVSMLCNKLLK